MTVYDKYARDVVYRCYAKYVCKLWMVHLDTARTWEDRIDALNSLIMFEQVP